MREKHRPNLLKNHIHTIEVTPGEGFWKTHMPAPLVKIIAGYAFDNITPQIVGNSIFFPNVDRIIQEVLFLAENAGPLEKFTHLVEKIILSEKQKKTESYILLDKDFTLSDGRHGKFAQCLGIGLDQTIYRDGEVLDLGMTTCFVDIVARLLPHKLKVLEIQLQQIVPHDNIKKIRESENIDALNQVFYGFKQDDEKIFQKALSNFHDHVENTKDYSSNELDLLTNTLYYINLLHLIASAFQILHSRFDELGPAKFHKAMVFCLLIIGKELQSRLPPRLKQILEQALETEGVWESMAKASREIVLEQGDSRLGVDYFFDGLGPKILSADTGDSWWQEGMLRGFQIFHHYYNVYYEQISANLRLNENGVRSRCSLM